MSTLKLEKYREAEIPIGVCAQPPRETPARECCPAPVAATCCSSNPRQDALPGIPGYALYPFVSRFLDTPAGPVPVVRTRLERADRLGAIGARLGATRHDYKVTPGLYGVGDPGADSPVVVSANYKLTFDVVRRDLAGRDAWILVVDTRGINVWCAAGKGTFSTAGVVRAVKASGLDAVVRHRRLILPQLGATGVSAIQVKRECGFEVVWGPIRSSDLKAYLEAGMVADDTMRRVTFSTLERAVLIPVEVTQLGKQAFWICLALLILSGLGGGFFSLGAAWSRGILAIGAYAMGVVTGCVVTPLLLPWIPGRAFSVKGAIAGGVAGILMLLLAGGGLGFWESMALVAWLAAVSSYQAMCFTGSTPFTSPSGVEKEMRAALPLQAGAAALAAIAWVGAAFFR